MAYCTPQQVRDAGGDRCAGAGDLTDLIAEAAERINRFCGDLFEPTSTSVVAVVGENGVAPLPLKVQSITSVTFVGSTAPVGASAYIVRSSSVRGEIDAIEFYSQGSNMLIVGAEPWNGGYLNLIRSRSRITAAGSLGWSACPRTVSRGAAKLAAWMLAHEGVADTPDPRLQSFRTMTYSETYFSPSENRIPSTGNEEVDALLWNYRRRATRFG